MADRAHPQVSSRKRPKQARSAELVAAILEAASQVLAQQGARRFTTARVAEKAGVSIGSLYQYFPNKAAILFRLQSDEWRRTSARLRSLLTDSEAPPFERLRALVHAFIRSECEEAAIRSALGDAAPRYRDAPEAREARTFHSPDFRAFLSEALPGPAEADRAAAGELIAATLAAVGERFSERPRPPVEIEAFADAMADMFCAYLGALERSESPPRLPLS